MAKEQKTEAVRVERLERAEATLYLLGSDPLIMNRMAAKAKQQLLLPPRAKNRAEREMVLKHEPDLEYRDSVYRCRDSGAPTYVHFPSGSFKKAMANAAVDTPGATKAQSGRLIKVIDETVYIWGKPFLYMAVVRQAGFRAAPDIRTRAIFPKWATKITVQYVRNLIREQDIVNLLDGAGMIIGIGDGRTEKGTFNYGGWQIVAKDDKRWHDIVRTGGRVVQEAAMRNPECFDEDTEELYSWYHAEVIRREKNMLFTGATATPKKKSARAQGDGTGEVILPPSTITGKSRGKRASA